MNKVSVTIIVLLFTCAYSYAQVQVQSGTYFYSKDVKGYTLHENQGKRSVDYEINFTKPFDKKPKVILTVTLLDAERSTQARFNVVAKGISRDGFVLQAEVWGDTQLNAIGGYWMAHTEE